MSWWVLDADHVSLYQRGHPQVQARVAATPPDQLAITIITVEEQLRGRLSQIRSAASGLVRIQAYARLHEAVDYFKTVHLLDFDNTANTIYESLRQQKIRISTGDLRIAAIALAVGGVLITRNQADFSQVPGLILEDWTK
jgi:tRNA(fMet)-specific endonuclease VapC